MSSNRGDIVMIEHIIKGCLAFVLFSCVINIVVIRVFYIHKWYGSHGRWINSH